VLIWRNRYDAGRVGALQDLARSGRPPVHDEVTTVVTTLAPAPPKLGGVSMSLSGGSSVGLRVLVVGLLAGLAVAEHCVEDVCASSG
jgi:hypothetical protein